MNLDRLTLLIPILDGSSTDGSTNFKGFKTSCVASLVGIGISLSQTVDEFLSISEVDPKA